MKVYDRLKNGFISNNSYYISFSDNSIYILNYKDIDLVNDTKLKISFSNFSIEVIGINLTIKRKNKHEIELSGQISKMEIVNEI